MIPAASPFIDVDGVFNFRDIGGYGPSKDPLCSVRRCYVFRCANPGRVTAVGAQQIRELGIMKIFDLRSPIEIERTKDYAPIAEVACVERVSVPVFLESEYPAHQSVKNLGNYISANGAGAKSVYGEILIGGKTAFRTIFLHIRDKPFESRLIHCSLGKDRTGVVTALILGVAGVDDADIIREYHLSVEGLQPMRPSVTRYLSEKSGPEWTDKQASKLLDVRLEAMTQMLEILRIKYGGAEAYLKTQCDLSDQDIAAVKENLLTKGDESSRSVQERLDHPSIEGKSI